MAVQSVGDARQALAALAAGLLYAILSAPKAAAVGVVVLLALYGWAHLDLKRQSLKLDTLAAAAEAEYADLESLERTLTALEDKLIATQRARLTEDELIAARRELDLQLKPYRSKMSADQLAMLEKQYLDRRLLERAGIPRLSLFYLH